GALSVHLVCGIFGTIAVGLFAAPSVLAGYGMDEVCKPGLFYGGGVDQLISQFIGIVTVGAAIFIPTLAIWGVLKMTTGIRVSEQEETEGLDIGEHGMEAYPGFAGDAVGFGPISGTPITSPAAPTRAGQHV